MKKHVTTIISMAALLFGMVQFSRAEDPRVSLSKPEKGTYNLEGEFYINSPVHLIWNVLTDYNNIASFVSAVEESKSEEISPNTHIMEQTTYGHFFIFSKKIKLVLKIVEDPMQQLAFEDLAKKDFKEYKGTWEIFETNNGQGYRVQYRLKADPAFFSPSFITRGAFQNGVVNYLKEVETEIKNRTLA